MARLKRGKTLTVGVSRGRVGTEAGTGGKAGKESPTSEIIHQLKKLNEETVKQTLLLEEQKANQIEANDKLAEIITLLTNTTVIATNFTFKKRTEPMEGDPPMPDFPGPVPPGHRVIVTVTSKDADGNKAPINGELLFSRDDDGLINIKPLEEKTVWDLYIDPPSDLTHDTTVSVMDSDQAPADHFTVDWDGPVVVPEAVGFGFSIRTEEMPSTGGGPTNTSKKK